MANRALVIGIDEYWTERACLNGAVNDALAMRKWLLATDGVSPRNLKLLLSPRASRKPKRLSYEPATRKNILDAVEELVESARANASTSSSRATGSPLTSPTARRA